MNSCPNCGSFDYITFPNGGFTCGQTAACGTCGYKKGTYFSDVYMQMRAFEDIPSDEY